MPHTPRSRLLLALLLASCARPPAPPTRAPTSAPPVAPARPAPAPSHPEVIVGGWIVHPNTGARLSGALVILACEPSPRREQTTGVDGSFVFRDVPPGACTLQTLLKLDNQSLGLRLAPGDRRLLDIPMDPERRFTIDRSTFFRGEIN